MRACTAVYIHEFTNITTPGGSLRVGLALPFNLGTPRVTREVEMLPGQHREYEKGRSSVMLCEGRAAEASIGEGPPALFNIVGENAPRSLDNMNGSHATTMLHVFGSRPSASGGTSTIVRKYSQQSVSQVDLMFTHPAPRFVAACYILGEKQEIRKNLPDKSQSSDAVD